MKTNLWKVLRVLPVFIALNACSVKQGDNGGQAGDNQVDLIDSASLRVVISQVSTIPTNIGINGYSMIRIDNHTATDLYLEGYEFADEGSSNLVAKGLHALKRVVGVSSSHPRVNVAGCDGLIAADNFCTILFTPNQRDGSVVLSMDFKDKNGKKYHAAQLIEYSSRVPQHNHGFYVSNNHIATVLTDSSYSLSIPYVSDDLYESVAISSSIGVLSQSNSCEGGASKGSLCTALLILPAPNYLDEDSYQNQIIITGTKPDGAVSRAVLVGKTVYGKNGHLAMTRGPLTIKSGTQVVEVNLVNNGVGALTSVVESSALEWRWVAGEISSTTGELDLDKSVICNDTLLDRLPLSLSPGESCKVKFTLKQVNLDLRGLESYKVAYDVASPDELGALAGLEAKIYYRGESAQVFNYDISGEIDLRNVPAGEVLSTSLEVENTGESGLVGISYLAEPVLPDDLIINPNSSSCLAYDKQVLAPQEKCIYAFDYTPASPEGVRENRFTVLAQSHQSVPVSLTPAKSLSIRYSAVEAPTGNSLRIYGADSNNLKIFSNNTNKIEGGITLENTGSTDFVLQGITASNWPTTLKMLKTSGNPLAEVNTTSGNYTSETGLTIKPKERAYLRYEYGPTDRDEQGVVQQKILGRFVGTSTLYKLPIVTRYLAEKGGVTVMAESVMINNMWDSAENKFYLTLGNQATVKFKYSAGELRVSNFLIHDSDLPYGFIVEPKYTTCKTTSLNGTQGQDLKVNTDCYVAYTYLSSLLDHSLYYTAAVDKITTIKPPAYSVGNGVQLNAPDISAAVSLEARPFIKITPTITSQYTYPDGYSTEYTITFTGLNYASALFGVSDKIIIRPIFDSNEVYKVSEESCEMSANNLSCSIRVMRRATDKQAAYTLQFNVSSTKDSTFNSINSSVLLD
jgi:hypothetical protein